MDSVTSLAFSTIAETEIRQQLHTSRVPLIDLLDLHVERVEAVLGTNGVRVAARPHRMGTCSAYNTRVAAVQSRRSGTIRDRYPPASGATVLVEGRVVGQKAGAGPVRVLAPLAQMHDFAPARCWSRTRPTPTGSRS